MPLRPVNREQAWLLPPTRSKLNKRVHQQPRVSWLAKSCYYSQKSAKSCRGKLWNRTLNVSILCFNYEDALL